MYFTALFLAPKEMEERMIKLSPKTQKIFEFLQEWQSEFHLYDLMILMINSIPSLPKAVQVILPFGTIKTSKEKHPSIINLLYLRLG